MERSNINLNTLAIPKVDVELLKSRLKAGNAILFTGAGFSKDTRNILGEEPPLASELALKIGKLINLDDDCKDLKLVSNLAMKFANPLDLLNLLKDNYTLNEVSESHNSIFKIPWKRFYTTNYDNSIELACNNAGKRVESLNIAHQPKDYLNQRNLCIHLNGAVAVAKEEDLIENIKLSNASYLSPESFLSSPWNSVFKRDLETASAIVFAGYSMYDIDVQRILFQTPNLMDKTYFIAREGAKFQNVFQLSDFGHVLPIGIKGFSELIKETERTISSEKKDPAMMESLILRERCEGEIEISDLDTRDFLLYGMYTNEQLDTAISTDYTIPFIIKREATTEAIRLLKAKKNLLVYSELGNGKSLFLETLSYHLSLDGYKCYLLDDNGGDYLQDFENILNQSGKSVIFVDDAHSYMDLIDLFSLNNPDNVLLVLADRSAAGNRVQERLRSTDVDFYGLCLDPLSFDEMSGLADILQDQGMWGELTGDSNEDKVSRIHKKYNGQISGVLLGLLNSPQIKEKIINLASSLFTNADHKDTLFAVALCDVLGVPKRSGLISDVAGNDAIYSVNLRNDPNFSSLYRFKANANHIETKSSLLSLSIINNAFDDLYVYKQLLKIVAKLNVTKENNKELNEIFTSILRFHTIEKLMPRKQDRLNSYYMELKRICTWLTKSPHFWVQYAMCRLSFGDLDGAEGYLKDAYGAGRKKAGYHFDNIDTQQARLYLAQALVSSDSNASFSLFEEANKLLINLPNDGKKFRQVIPYKEYFENKYIGLNKGKKVKFEQACKNLMTQIESDDIDDYVIISNKNGYFTNKAKKCLQEIIDDICSKRK
jgi:hypothetical protein